MRRSFRFGRSGDRGRYRSLAWLAAARLCGPSLQRPVPKRDPAGSRPWRARACRGFRSSIFRSSSRIPGWRIMPAHMRNMRRFGFPSAPQEGTTLALLIEEPQQWILSLETKRLQDHEVSRRQRHRPGPGERNAEEGDLRFNPQPGPENCTLSGEVDPAGHRATVTVHSPHFPAGGANRLSLEADLVMRFGHGEKTVEQKNVNLKLDTITVGPSPLVVMMQEPSGGMGEGGSRTPACRSSFFIKAPSSVRSGRSPLSIPTVRRSSRGAAVPDKAVRFTRRLLAHRKVETCTVRLTVPEKIETVTLSFAIDTGVGFPPGARRRALRSLEPHAKITGSGDAIPKTAAGNSGQ